MDAKPIEQSSERKPSIPDLPDLPLTPEQETDVKGGATLYDKTCTGKHFPDAKIEL